MTWRSVVITKPSYLKLKDKGLVVVQNEEEVKIPLEDIAVLLIDNPQVTLSSQLLSACASQQVTLITVGADHHPNGVLLPFIPHSRALQVIHRQINMGNRTQNAYGSSWLSKR
jgi:CRISPR-associated protein Cas1